MKKHFRYCFMIMEDLHNTSSRGCATDGRRQQLRLQNKMQIKQGERQLAQKSRMGHHHYQQPWQWQHAPEGLQLEQRAFDSTALTAAEHARDGGRCCKAHLRGRVRICNVLVTRHILVMAWVSMISPFRRDLLLEQRPFSAIVPTNTYACKDGFAEKKGKMRVTT